MGRRRRWERVAFRARASGSVACCWAESEGKRSAEAVLEEDLEACAENAPLFEFEGTDNEVGRGG